MDPVSIISIVSTCVSAAVKSIKALQTIHDFYGSYNNAPNGIRYLIGDVTTAKLVLLNIQGDVTSGTLLFPKLYETLSDAFELCVIALKRVEIFASEHQRLTSSRSSRAGYTWNEKHIKGCRAELEHQMNFLNYTHNILFNSRSTPEAQQKHLEELEKLFTKAETTNVVNSGSSNPTPLIFMPLSTPGQSNRAGFFSWARIPASKKMSKQLIEAAGTADIPVIEQCLKSRANVNYQSKSSPPEQSGMAAIHNAAKHGHLRVIELLVREGADVNLTTSTRRHTPLHLAATNGFSEVVRFLLRNEAKVDVEDSLGQTPLMEATDAIKIILLEKGANPKVRGIDANTALHYAANFGSVDVVRKLVECGADVNACNKLEQTPLWLACSNGDIVDDKSLAIVSILLESSASPNLVSKIDDTTPFHIAVLQNKLNLVKKLLHHGADIMSQTASNMFPIHIAATHKSGLVLESLLQRYLPNVDIAAVHPRDENIVRTALHIAVLGGSLDCVDVLLNANASLTVSAPADGLGPLHLAFKSAPISVVLRLIKEHQRRGLTIVFRDSVNSHLPIELISNPELVKVWADAGGPLNNVNVKNNSLVHQFILTSTPSIVNALIANGADLKALNTNGRTPIEDLCFHEQAWKTPFDGLSEDRLAVLKVLLEHTEFTRSCRKYIYDWKNDKLRAAVTQKLPWQTLSEMASVTWENRKMIIGFGTAALLGLRKVLL